MPAVPSRLRAHEPAYVCLAALFLLSVTQGRVVLEAGDVLVAYTDGISEAMNAADDEWGEDQLMGAVRANPSAASRPLIEWLMTAADAFVAGAPQHDDMTLVVVRVIEAGHHV